MVSRLKPDATFPCSIEEHGFEALCGVYNISKIPELKSNYEVMKYICSEYNCVLDFSCGFGNIIPFVLESEKNFIVSDVCKDCIAFIAEDYMGRKL